ncbi:ribosome biogenesis GTPase Der [Atopobium fossor]|uniref:ribosome biogenesis GTPase Der n=1 Tax=Atopobium fossor TaxID=39487 RepID=UPI0003FDF414|nr:ribosome biogenesis GTPase Der [Atopobium fossor]
MTKPIVAVVGRPNVGKSTLVNRIAQDKEAIVHESRGVTRDRSYHEADWSGRDFILIDTGGMEPSRSDDVFASRIKEQAVAACEEADAIIFVVDGSVGVTDEDEEVARVLRKTKKPVFLCVNKLDNPASEGEIWDFYSLGIGEPIALSAVHGHGTGDLLDDIIAVIPEDNEDVYTDDMLNVAIVGRPNVGKSSLTNKLAGRARSIVSDVAGTTRDAIDVVVEQNNQKYRLVDTAGMRKRNVVHEDIEYYSMVRGLRAMDKADVCLLVIDSTDGVTEQDQKVAAMAIERGCALAVLLNKWDLLEDDQQREDVISSITQRLTFASWAPYVRISALTGRSVDKVLQLASQVARARSQRISTANLNKLVTRLRETGHTVVDKSRRLKIKYATQVSVNPPTFTFFCNAPDLVDDNYEHYLENRLRETYPLEGTPIRLRFRKKD